MLFNSYSFIFAFLPATLFIYALVIRRGRHAAVWALLAASLIFYAGWDWHYLGLIVVSAIGNFAAGMALTRTRSQILLAVAVVGNLMLLAYFKYLGFLGNALAEMGLPHWNASIVLPLGISFLTFHQIAYLVEARRGKVVSHGFHDYALYIAFFPHLIAGPIVRPSDLLVRIVHHGRHMDARRMAIGLSFFSIGLAKKVLLADGLAEYVDPFYQWMNKGGIPGFLDSWGAALAYSFQLYFDFSGYSDMAVGLGMMLGLRLPVNFLSPYKATSLIDFWRRWHITLSHFLRDYLYIPLGGSRHGKARQFAALLVTMTLCGLWHGAGYTFILWGFLHGMLLVINHLWRMSSAAAGAPGQARRIAGWALTFLTVTGLWVVFRASTVDVAGKVLGGMVGFQGITLPLTYQDQLAALKHFGVNFDQIDYFNGMSQLGALALSAFVVLTLPNAYQWLLPTFARIDTRMGSKTPSWLRWYPGPRMAWILGGVTAVALLFMAKPTVFLYFQF